MNLRKELKRYDELTCPDYLYDAWRILFAGRHPPDRQEILRQAEFDLQEGEDIRKQHVFNRDRRNIPKLERAKFNWSSK